MGYAAVSAGDDWTELGEVIWGVAGLDKSGVGARLTIRNLTVGNIATAQEVDNGHG